MNKNKIKKSKKMSTNLYPQDENNRPAKRRVIDWSKGRCFKCGRRGQLYMQCRECKKDHSYEHYVGECTFCKELGSLSLPCISCRNEDSECLVPHEMPDFDPLEPETVEKDEDDSDLSYFQEELEVSGYYSIDESSKEYRPTKIDWSKGRCLKCGRRGQLDFQCRGCKKDHTYEYYIGECTSCKKLGDFEIPCTCDNESYCEVPYEVPPLDPCEPETVEKSDDDHDLDYFQEFLGVSEYFSVDESSEDDEYKCDKVMMSCRRSEQS